MPRPILIALAALAVAIPAHAQMFKCTDPATGRPVFSQVQCAPDAAPVEVDVHQPTPEQVEAHQRQVEENRAYLDETIARRRAFEAAAARQRAAERLAAARARELAVIDAKRARAANNLAGAAWENALSQDAANVDARYQAEMDRLRGVR